MKLEEYEWEVRGPVVLAILVSTGEVLLRITRDNDGIWSFWRTFEAQYPLEQYRRLCEFKDADSAMAAFDKRMAAVEESRRVYLERQQKAREEFAKPAEKPAEKNHPWYRRLFR